MISPAAKESAVLVRAMISTVDRRFKKPVYGYISSLFLKVIKFQDQPKRGSDRTISEIIAKMLSNHYAMGLPAI